MLAQAHDMQSALKLGVVLLFEAGDKAPRATGCMYLARHSPATTSPCEPRRVGEDCERTLRLRAGRAGRGSGGGRGQVDENSAFGVVKPEKVLEDERPVLRLMIYFRFTNGYSGRCAKSDRSCCGATAVMLAGNVLTMSADDLVAALYVFIPAPNKIGRD